MGGRREFTSYLGFLGAVEDQKYVIDKLKNISPLKNEIGIKKLGFFGKPPKVFFAKTEVKLLDWKIKEFKATGFDLHSFKPHITLCHIKTIHNYKAYRETLEAYRDKTLGHILPEINLYESTFTSKGTQYACRQKIENLI